MPHAALALLLALAPTPDDWPGWGGPARTGVSAESSWTPRGKAEPLWRTEVGLGYSSVAVAGGRLFTLGHDAELGLDVVRCLDALTGEERWAHAFPSELWNQYHAGGTLTTPAVADGRVYVSEREGMLVCLAADSGEVVWEQPWAKELGLAPPTWGFAASPLVRGDELILNYGRVLAVARDDGALRWKSAEDYGHAYSTPAELELRGEPALAVFAGRGLALVSARDGRELALTPWKTRHDVNAMTPLVLGTRLFLSSGYERGCALLELSGAKPEVVWESKVMRNQMSGCVAWEGRLYGFDDKVLKCIDLDGQERWRERGLGQGALSIAGGRLLVVSEDGELIVAETGGDAFRELARTRVFDGGTCWTVPVLANGVVYVRNQAGELAALDHRLP